MTFSNADIQFAERELTWRFYTTAKVLSTTKWVEFINKKKFAKAALDVELETFVMYIVVLEALGMTIHPSQIAQIIGDNSMKIAALKQD